MVKTIKKYQLVLESTSGEQTLIVSKKSIKRIIFRYDEINRFFKVSAPIFSTQKQIKALFYEKEGQILALKTKKELPLSENLFYFGVEFDSYAEILQVNKTINLAEFERLVKPRFLAHLKTRTAHFEKMMNIPIAHKVRIRKMKTRWGTNSLRTRTITFNLQLLHFDAEIIDAIVIHELAHYYIGGHQKDFYQLIDKYCPNYKVLARNLKRGNYGNK